MKPSLLQVKQTSARQRQTFWLLVMPMLGIVAAIRGYVHLVQIHHIYLAGYVVHHLFWGVLLVLPSSFVLAFRPPQHWLANVATVVLGAGAGLVLDEIVYLVATNGTDKDYVSGISVGGSLLFISLAVIVLFVFYKRIGD
jgi:hypothetical protein